MFVVKDAGLVSNGFTIVTTSQNLTIYLQTHGWTPEGTKIAFARFVVDSVIDGVRFGHYDIFVMNADGTEPTNLTNGGDSNVSPSWSSDGP